MYRCSDALVNRSSPHWLTTHHRHRFLIISLTNSLCSLAWGCLLLGQNSNQVLRERSQGFTAVALMPMKNKEEQTEWNRDGDTLLRKASSYEWFRGISAGCCRLKLCVLWLLRLTVSYLTDQKQLSPHIYIVYTVYTYVEAFVWTCSPHPLCVFLILNVSMSLQTKETRDKWEKWTEDEERLKHKSLLPVNCREFNAISHFGQCITYLMSAM